jgi:hypothetical protein
MRLGQLEPCEHDALRRIGGESLIKREIQIQRGVSRNWACPEIGRVTSIPLLLLLVSCMLLSDIKPVSQEAKR